MKTLYREVGKRYFDFLLASIGLVVVSPLLIVIAAAVKLTSRGPVFYRQERIGYLGRPFEFLKFRTMIVGAESMGAGILCVKNDPRVTFMGRILRRFSLDELPQLLNVLRGEMSLIGPRPGLAYQAAQYTTEQRRRLSVLPGITGWAQVNGRNSLTWNQRIELDLEYIDGLSFTLDLRILLRTAGAVLRAEALIAQKDYFREKAGHAGEQR